MGPLFCYVVPVKFLIRLMKVKQMQKYDNFTENSHLNTTSGYLLVKFNEQALKSMSDIGIKTSDTRYIPMFEAFMNMRRMRMKAGAVLQILSEDYGVSVSTVKRIIRRFRRSAAV